MSTPVAHNHLPVILDSGIYELDEKLETIFNPVAPLIERILQGNLLFKTVCVFVIKASKKNSLLENN